MPQQAVTKGKGKKEYFRPQLMMVLSREVIHPVPKIVSRPIQTPFCYAQAQPGHRYPAVLPGVHDCRGDACSSQAALPSADSKGQADEVFVCQREKHQGPLVITDITGVRFAFHTASVASSRHKYITRSRLEHSW